MTDSESLLTALNALLSTWDMSSEVLGPEWSGLAERIESVRAAMPVDHAQGAAWPLDNPVFSEPWFAMVAEMAQAKNPPTPAMPAARPCSCGYPEKPCLRLVLRNGPPFPPRPCEPS